MVTADKAIHFHSCMCYFLYEIRTMFTAIQNPLFPGNPMWKPKYENEQNWSSRFGLGES